MYILVPICFILIYLLLESGFWRVAATSVRPLSEGARFGVPGTAG